MGWLEYKQFYARRLPHIHPPDAVFFITFRLADSIPRAGFCIKNALTACAP